MHAKRTFSNDAESTSCLRYDAGMCLSRISATDHRFGTVYEPDGLPAIGASVVAEGNTLGVVTDVDGNYTIQVASDGKLVFSYIGCDTQVIEVAGRTNIDVHLVTNTTTLQEVVAIGYGAVKSLTQPVRLPLSSPMKSRPVSLLLPRTSS